MNVEVVTAVDDALVAAVARLMPQLSKAPAPTKAELEAMLAQPGCTLFVARDGGIVGMLVLLLQRIPTGFKGRIEDVVVDEAGRGKGIGEALCRAALELARDVGAKNVSLTSAPHREAANRLYVRLGFEPITTNVYRFSL
jgi:ribosomal protein S18 acetylase RimI-like enzyme